MVYSVKILKVELSAYSNEFIFQMTNPEYKKRKKEKNRR